MSLLWLTQKSDLQVLHKFVKISMETVLQLSNLLEPTQHKCCAHSPSSQ